MPDDTGEKRTGLLRLYGASKTEHAHLWRDVRDELREDGVDIVSTWIDEAGEGESASLVDLWVRCIEETRSAHLLVAYHREGDVWKGAFVEVGAALANGIPVYVMGRPPGSWTNHPLVMFVSSVDEAIEDYRSAEECAVLIDAAFDPSASGSRDGET